MCTAAVRPNRAISAFGSASWFVMVPVALASVRSPLEGLDSVTVNDSMPSLCSWSMTSTSILPDELPASIVSVPLVEV